ncbi:hypothetical protein [Bacteroides ovatus]|uniref:hypothetical protein n=1 Tax=Bacteroides ovatus TaxID=28116 RepID=UPI0011C05478|nr:hypothetical protein [Bacteroides ovatus]QGT72444.1 hypothetical protein FOC41_16405 [Bacteroides ovatus]
MGKCRTKRIAFASGLSSDCSPCRRVVRGNACSGNTAAHTAPLPTAALRQCFSRKVPSPAAFLGMAVFLCTVPLSLLCRSHPMGAKKAALRQLTEGSAAKEHSPRRCYSCE